LLLAWLSTSLKSAGVPLRASVALSFGCRCPVSVDKRTIPVSNSAADFGDTLAGGDDVRAWLNSD
jgi:hypothetical protein